MSGTLIICCGCEEYGGDPMKCGKWEGSGPPCPCDCHRAKPLADESVKCATCRVRLAPINRSVCFSCFPQGSEEAIGISGRIQWWMRIAEAKQEERDAALDQLLSWKNIADRHLARIAELERALRYAAECSTLEMVRDTARGMGVIQ